MARRRSQSWAVATFIIGLAAAASGVAGAVVLQGHARPVRAVALSPDGTRVVSGDEDGVLRVWDAATGKCLATVQAHQGVIHDLAVSPNGKGIATAGADNCVKVWSMASFACLRSFTPPGRAKTLVDDAFEHAGMKTGTGAHAVGFSGNTQFVTSGHADLCACVWDIKTGVFKCFRGDQGQQIAGKAPGEAVLAAAISPNAQVAACGSRETHFKDVLGKSTTWAYIQVWNPYTTELIASFDAKNSVLFLAFLPDNLHLVSGLGDGRIVVWDARKGKPVKALNHGEAARDFAMAYNGKRLVSCSRTAVKVWDLDTGAAKGIQGEFNDDFASVGISGDGTRIAVGNANATIKLLDVGQLAEDIWGGGQPDQPKPADPKQPGPQPKPKEKIWD